MKRALSEYRVIGIRTNIPFHRSLLGNQEFLDGNFNTQFLSDEMLTQLVDGQEEDKTLAEIAALAAVLATNIQTRQSAVFVQRGKRDESNWKWTSRWEHTRE
jgi:pyruvate carboxylase